MPDGEERHDLAGGVLPDDPRDIWVVGDQVALDKLMNFLLLLIGRQILEWSA